MNILTGKKIITWLVTFSFLILFACPAMAEVACRAGMNKCPSGCANMLSDKANCGGCNRTCPRGKVCESGNCK